MFKHVFLIPKPANEVEFYRFYYRYHSKECVRYYGPWLTRYEHFRGYATPPEAERYTVMGGGLTELWYRSVEDWIEADPYRRPYTTRAPSGQQPSAAPAVRGAVTMVAAMPTDDFLGKEPTPEEVPIMRWYQVIKYPDDVSVEEGEKWYNEVYAQEAKEQPGLLYFKSHRAIENCPIANPWHRLTEMWYRDLDAWRKAVIESPPKYTKPPWGKEEPFVDMQSTFVGYKPTVDFLKGNPIIP